MIEKEFITEEGYQGLCVFTDVCYRCGYVGIPVDHPFFMRSCCNSDFQFDVHGGLTYDGLMKAFPRLWFFGFDCAHSYDARDYETGRKYGMDVKKLKELCGSSDFLKDHIWTLKEVVKEIKSLSKQLLPENLVLKQLTRD